MLVGSETLPSSVSCKGHTFGGSGGIQSMESLKSPELRWAYRDGLY